LNSSPTPNRVALIRKVEAHKRLLWKVLCRFATDKHLYLASYVAAIAFGAFAAIFPTLVHEFGFGRLELKVVIVIAAVVIATPTFWKLLFIHLLMYTAGKWGVRSPRMDSDVSRLARHVRPYPRTKSPVKNFIRYVVAVPLTVAWSIEYLLAEVLRYVKSIAAAISKVVALLSRRIDA
jgi:hypothetical protein